MRVLKNDFSRYTRTAEDLEDEEEETGWGPFWDTSGKLAKFFKISENLAKNLANFRNPLKFAKFSEI